MSVVQIPKLNKKGRNNMAQNQNSDWKVRVNYDAPQPFTLPDGVTFQSPAMQDYIWRPDKKGLLEFKLRQLELQPDGKRFKREQFTDRYSAYMATLGASVYYHVTLLGLREGVAITEMEDSALRYNHSVGDNIKILLIRSVGLKNRDKDPVVRAFMVPMLHVVDKKLIVEWVPLRKPLGENEFFAELPPPYEEKWR